MRVIMMSSQVPVVFPYGLEENVGGAVLQRTVHPLPPAQVLPHTTFTAT